MMFSNSCVTKKVETEVYMPEIDFPDFPLMDGYQILEDGRVAIDANYFRKLLIFKTEYEDLILEYQEKKNIKEGVK